jgi:hypothetical protein
MVAHDHVEENMTGHLLDDEAKDLKEMPFLALGFEDELSVVAALDDVVDGTWGVDFGRMHRSPLGTGSLLWQLVISLILFSFYSFSGSFALNFACLLILSAGSVVQRYNRTSIIDDFRQAQMEKLFGISVTWWLKRAGSSVIQGADTTETT